MNGGHLSCRAGPDCCRKACSMIRHRDLRGAVVVIVGASSGIGRATALAFAAHNAHVVLAARSREALCEVERVIESRGAQALVVPTDITNAAEVERLGQQAVDHFGRIDVWVEVRSEEHTSE